MDNRILRVEVRDHVLTPAAAETHFIVQTEFRTPSTAIRGRLHGPRCHFATTVEVGYPLQNLAPANRSTDDRLTARVAIPEPSLWDLESPFLYEGSVELWESDHRCDIARVRHGLREIRFSPRGIAVNGKRVTIKSKEMKHACTDDEALRLRQAGFNLIIAPVTDATAALWDIGDRLGILLVGRVASNATETIERITALHDHPCSLGWLAENCALPRDLVLPPEVIALLLPVE
jgi:hypothetical protein